MSRIQKGALVFGGLFLLFWWAADLPLHRGDDGVKFLSCLIASMVIGAVFGLIGEDD